MKLQALKALTEDLVEGGLLIETRNLVTRQSGRSVGIEVGNTSPIDGVEGYEEGSARFYLETLRQNRLSWMLFDGSMVQISYRLTQGAVDSHRYCYIPAPFEVDLRGFLGDDLVDAIEGASALSPLTTSRRGILRFECDLEAQGIDHAASHLHLNTAYCRIPMRSPISPREFVYFLVKFLYSNQFSTRICGGISFSNPETITTEEQAEFHISWRRSA